MKTKKYELLKDQSVEVQGVTLHRIQYLQDILEHNVISGDLGGWIESEYNLSQEGSCCILDDCYVMGCATVVDDAVIYEKAFIQGNAEIKGKSSIYGSSRIKGNSIIIDSTVRDGSEISGPFICNSLVEENSVLSGSLSIEKSDLRSVKGTGYATIVDCDLRDATIRGYIKLRELKFVGGAIDGRR